VAVAPPEFRVFAVGEVPLNAPAVMAQLAGFLYAITGPGDPAAVRGQAHAVLTAPSIPVERPAKEKGDRPRTVDVRPNIARIDVKDSPPGRVELEVELHVLDGRGIRMRELLDLLGLDPMQTRFLKRETFLRS